MSLSDRDIMEELESWKGFGDALKAEDRELFTEMLRSCYEYIPSMHAKASPFSAEESFVSGTKFLSLSSNDRLTTFRVITYFYRDLGSQREEQLDA